MIAGIMTHDDRVIIFYCFKSEEVRQEVSTTSVNCILLRAHSRSMRLEQ